MTIRKGSALRSRASAVVPWRPSRKAWLMMPLSMCEWDPVAVLHERL